MQWTQSNTSLDLTAYDENGYALLGPTLTAEGLERGREALDRMFADLHPSLNPYEIYSAHQTEPWLLALTTSDSLLDVVQHAVGRDIVVWSTHLICKPPNTKRDIPWHQDGAYWNLAGRMTSIWIPFDDVDDENGTMYVLPGYHKNLMTRRDTGDDLFNEEITPEALPTDIEQQQVPYNLRAGDAGMHHVLIPHRSPVNRSKDRWRRVLVIRYMSADGDMSVKQYPDYRTAKMFDRQFILARGRDTNQRGLMTREQMLQNFGPQDAKP